MTFGEMVEGDSANSAQIKAFLLSNGRMKCVSEADTLTLFRGDQANTKDYLFSVVDTVSSRRISKTKYEIFRCSQLKPWMHR